MNNPTRRPARQRVKEKVERAATFANEVSPRPAHHFEIWSPRVRPGLVAELSTVIEEFRSHKLQVELIANDEYTTRIQQLIEVARSNRSTTGEGAFRLLQILTHVPTNQRQRRGGRVRGRLHS